MIEDAIRRFVTKGVTSQRRRTDIFDILNRYIRLLRDPLSDTYVTQINISMSDTDNKTEVNGCLERDLHILAISARMYGEILIKLADPDSNLYNDQVSRLYTLLSPLQSLLIAAKNSNHGDAESVEMDGFAEEVDTYFASDTIEPPADMIDLLRSMSTIHPPDIPQYEMDLRLLIKKVWETYDLNGRAINSGNRSIYTLLKATTA